MPGTKKMRSRRKLNTMVPYRPRMDTTQLATAAAALGYSAFAKRVQSLRRRSKAKKPVNPVLRTKKPRIRRRVGDEGTGGYTQWSQRYQQATFGKLTPRKIDKLSTDTVVFRHQNIGPFNDYGKRFMYNATDGSGNLYYPLVLFELNSVNNYINGTQILMNPVHQMFQFAGPSTNIGWNALLGQDNTAVNATPWQLEKSSHVSGTPSSYPMNMSIHKWSSLDLELWGQTTKPTVYTIYLCQLSEDVLPTTFYSGGVGSYQSQSDQNAVEFWQSMVKRYTYSPLAKIDDGFGNKKIKIMKQYKVNIDPTATYENDPDPHVKTMKLFYRFNRKSNFEWKFSTAAGQSIANMNDADWQPELGQNQNQVHPNARLFVMVRASNFTRSTLTDTTNAIAPSISWVMRSCHLVNP